MDDKDRHPLDIPPSLIRDSSNRAEFMNTEQQVVETDEVVEKPKPAKKKAKAAKPVKASAKVTKPKVKAKGSEKPKVAKPKGEKDVYGLRKGSSKSEAAAMYARKSGATLEEVKGKIGSIQLNVLNELEAEGWVVIREREERKGQRPLKRYFLKPKK